MIILIAAVSVIINRENKPGSHLLWASYDAFLDIFRIVFQFFVAIFLVLGEWWDILGIFGLILALFALAGLALRLTTGGEHRSWVDCLSIFQEIFTFNAHIGIFILYLMKYNASIPQIAGLMTLPMTYIYILFKSWSEQKVIKDMLPHQQKSENDIEIYIKKFLEFLDKPESDESYMTMTSILILHRQSCENPNCVCIELGDLTEKAKFNSEQASTKKKKDSLERYTDVYSLLKENWKNLLLLMIKEA